MKNLNEEFSPTKKGQKNDEKNVFGKFSKFLISFLSCFILPRLLLSFNPDIYGASDMSLDLMNLSSDF